MRALDLKLMDLREQKRIKIRKKRERNDSKNKKGGLNEIFGTTKKKHYEMLVKFTDGVCRHYTYDTASERESDIKKLLSYTNKGLMQITMLDITTIENFQERKVETVETVHDF